MIAFIFPGQGSQKVGMGRALAEAYPEAAAAFQDADAAFDVAAAPRAEDGRPRRLSEIVDAGPDALLTLTEVAQPAIVATSVAALRVLEARGIVPALVAGHSVGEYTAHVAAGTMTFADAIGLVQRRGRYMQDAVPSGQSGMAAVLGATLEMVQQACAEAAQGEVVSPANLNGGGQIVMAGTIAALQRAGERVKALGARRVIPLAVSAGFHSALMAPAEARLEPELRDLPVSEPTMPIVANVDAQPKRAAWAAIDALVRQISAPVLWEDVVRRLASEGVTTYVEVGPGPVLTGMMRKMVPDARAVHFGSPADLETVLTACSS